MNLVDPTNCGGIAIGVSNSNFLGDMSPLSLMDWRPCLLLKFGATGESHRTIFSAYFVRRCLCR